MKVKDGECVDFTKDGVPHPDERFKVSDERFEDLRNLPPAEIEILSYTLDKVQFCDDVTAIKETVNVIDPCLQYVEFNSTIPPSGTFIPLVTQPIVPASASYAPLMSKIGAHLDVLRSLQDETIEIKTTVKTLLWVLKLISEEVALNSKT